MPGSTQKRCYLTPHICIWFICLFSSVTQLFVVAFDNGEPVKTNSTLVEITVLQPSRIPIFTQEEYRFVSSAVFCHSVPQNMCEKSSRVCSGPHVGLFNTFHFTMLLLCELSGFELHSMTIKIQFLHVHCLVRTITALYCSQTT